MKTITHFLGGLAGVLTGLLWIASSISGHAQTELSVSVDARDYLSSYGLHEMEKPKRYAFAGPLTPDEIHLLDTLSDLERKIIEASTDPPAIGILRDLRSPVDFTTGNLPALDNGELSVSGGRLTRIDKNLLVWTTAIQSKGADEIRIFFSVGKVPPDVRINMFGRDDFAMSLAELQGQIGENGYFTPTVFADQVILQVVIPAESLDDDLSFSIPGIIHVDNRYIPEEMERDCYEDVNCSYANSFPGINSLKKSTARLRFLDGSNYYLCSGGLLNDSRSQDFQPFLLTANHCFDTQASASSLEARFDYYTTSCNGSTNPDYIIVNGSNLIATNSQSDFTMVLLKTQPGGTRTYLGWTTTSVDNDDTLHAVHHPGGIPQKYTRHLNKTSPLFTCTSLSKTNFHYTKTLGGQTAGGSSGGLIVQPDLKTVGQLYGHCYSGTFDPCTYSNYYNVWGKFSVSYSNNNLQYWLYGGGASVSMTTSPTVTLDFGIVTVGSSLDKTVTVTNNGTVPNYLNLEAGVVTISGLHAGQFAIIGASYLYLSPGQSGTFTIRFTPASAGSKTAALSIPHNADNLSSPKTITLSGSGQGTDPCASSLVIGGCGPSNAKTYTGGGTGVWFNSSANPCNYVSPGIEQIYSFLAPYTGTYSIQVTAASGWVDYLWRASSCASTGWTCIDDIASAGQYGSMSWTAGTTYYILLDDENNTTGTHTFYINCPVICKDCPAYDYTLIPSDEWNNHTAFHFAEGCILYRINAISGNKYFFKTGCGDGALATYNTYLALYNESCSLLTSDDNGCEMNRSVIEWTSTYTGYAYLKVSGNDDVEYGQFTLAYRCVPAVLTLQNITVPSGQIICNEALQSIIVAGGGTWYILSSGADVTMVAGEQILLKPGFHALQGSHFHALISDQGCSEPLKPVAVIMAEEDQLDEQHADAERLLDADNPLTTGGYLKIYPNPTTGRLAIEISPANPFELTTIHLYDFQGRMISRQENVSPGMTELDLGTYPNGIYLIRVMCANRLETVKVVKQD